MLDHLLLECRLIQRLFLKADGKGLQRRIGMTPDQRHQGRGIQTAGKISPDRHIRAQADPGGVSQQRVQLVAQFGVRPA